MTNDEKLEANKLIAIFMGVELGKDLYSWRPGCTEPIHAGHLDYDKTWGWLMPVVEKIEALGKWQIEIELFSCYVINSDNILSGNSSIVIESHEDSKIKAVYIAVVEFVKIYNTQKAQLSEIPPPGAMENK